MNNVIYKYALAIVGRQTISLPKYSDILSVKEQLGEVCVWVMHDIDSSKEKREILIFGTGQPAPDNIMDTHDFIDTVVAYGGAFIWHVFISKVKEGGYAEFV